MALSEAQILNRAYWIEKIRRFDGDFIVSVRSLEQELRAELDSLGLIGLIGHLELCGVIPESFRHDSSEEKLYSKYTDILLALAFEQLGLAVPIKKWNKPVIACCRSGMRSAQATSILKQHGIDCINGGGWQSLESKL